MPFLSFCTLGRRRNKKACTQSYTEKKQLSRWCLFISSLIDHALADPSVFLLPFRYSYTEKKQLSVLAINRTPKRNLFSFCLFVLRTQEEAAVCVSD
ncbi:hypothetical protein KP509_36G035400 [Ceratopteris richardii]|uniref:Uncharacterized protein n=1 Tax=Ceratopteris richardii TaxID=49495 RepID=A0A8T2QC20_CERRI|nr:hypothetical protein KP509_36G035400 [Ceratopteris richardii]